MSSLKNHIDQLAKNDDPVELLAAQIPVIGDQSGVLVQLRAWLAISKLPADSRLPPERELAETLGVTRAELRNGLAVLEAEGQIWRHVGRGTFLGARPTQASSDIASLAAGSNPAQVMQARIALEPELARLASIFATPNAMAELKAIALAGRCAGTWREYEAQDARFHHHIAEAAQNRLLMALLDTLNAVRRAVNWNVSRTHCGPPPPGHPSFDEHDKIVAAILSRDGVTAATAMRHHLQTVEDRLLGRRPDDATA